MTNYIPSTFNRKYDLCAIFPTVDETTGPDILSHPGKHVYNLDYLDQDLQNILNNITLWRTFTWTGQKWTTLCYQYQGTTSTWFINLAFNGLATPLQLQPGMNIRMPLIEQINATISKINSVSNIGKIITIGPPNVVG
jgi:hypothetical protein